MPRFFLSSITHLTQYQKERGKGEWEKRERKEMDYEKNIEEKSIKNWLLPLMITMKNVLTSLGVAEGTVFPNPSCPLEL